MDTRAIKYIFNTCSVLLVLYLLKDFIYPYRFIFMIISPGIAFLFLWWVSIGKGESFLQTLKNYITFIPCSYSFEEWKFERRIWVTYAFIFINIAIHYGLKHYPHADRENIIKAFMFIPDKQIISASLLRSITSMFLHINDLHLWQNMFFLWDFGVVVEERIGRIKFFIFYLLTGILGNMVCSFIYRTYLHEEFRFIGTSTAVAGIMGIFMVRFYFKKIVFPIPILGLISIVFPINLKIRINSLTVIGLFFISHLIFVIQPGGIINPTLNHWNLLCGMGVGIILAVVYKFHLKASEEMHIETGLEIIEEDLPFISGDGEKELKKALRYNPKSEKALLALAREKSRLKPTEEGKEYYRKLIRASMRSNPNKAAIFFAEYFQTYWANIEPELQYSIAGILFRKKEYEVAYRAIERLCDDISIPGNLRKKSLLQLILMAEKLDFPDQVRFRCRQFLEQFPDSPDVEHVRRQLKRYEG